MRDEFILDTTSHGSHDSCVREIEDEVDTLIPDSDTREPGDTMSNEIRRCIDCETLTNCAICLGCGKDTLPIEKPAERMPTVPVASLAQRHSRAKAEVKALKTEIDNCAHEWVEGEAGLATHVLELGESIGSSNTWVLRHHRDCSLCGLHQMQTKYEPDWDWSDWE